MARSRTLPDDIVLDRATAVFWRRGYAASSLRDLTQATGLSAAALYNRFQDKEGLFLDVLRRYADERLTPRLTDLAARLEPLDAIRALFDGLVTLSHSDPERKGCLLVNTALDGAPATPDAIALVRERFLGMESFFVVQLRRAVEAGALPPELDVAATAGALLGSVLGIRVLARLDPDPTRLRAVADHALRFLPHQPHAVPPEPDTVSGPS